MKEEGEIDGSWAWGRKLNEQSGLAKGGGLVVAGLLWSP